MHLMLLAGLAEACRACTGCSIGTTGTIGACSMVQLDSSLGCWWGPVLRLIRGLWPLVPISLGNATLVVSKRVYV
jgi:hypothetical protein